MAHDIPRIVVAHPTKPKPNDMAFKVERDVPFPSNLEGRSNYPFRSMNVGDSFVVPASFAGKIRAAASYFSLRNPEFQFTCRKTRDGEFRVWRVVRKNPDKDA